MSTSLGVAQGLKELSTLCLHDAVAVSIPLRVPIYTFPPTNLASQLLSPFAAPQSRLKELHTLTVHQGFMSNSKSREPCFTFNITFAVLLSLH